MIVLLFEAEYYKVWGADSRTQVELRNGIVAWLSFEIGDDEKTVEKLCKAIDKACAESSCAREICIAPFSHLTTKTLLPAEDAEPFYYKTVAPTVAHFCETRFPDKPYSTVRFNTRKGMNLMVGPDGRVCRFEL
jgi:hypothetical protein